MATIVIRQNAKAARLAGRVGGRATARGMARRAMDCAAATVLACAVGAALLQLVAELASFPAPVAVTAITVMAAALLNSLRRHIRTHPGHWYRPGNPHSLAPRRCWPRQGHAVAALAGNRAVPPADACGNCDTPRVSRAANVA